MVKLVSSAELNNCLESSLKYRKRSEKYFNNAILEGSKHNFDKATEFLWGAIAEAVKSIYALSGRSLTNHREIRDGLKEIVLNEEELEKGIKFIRCAERLHANFYEGFADEVEFLSLSQTAYELISRLFRILRTSTEQ